MNKEEQFKSNAMQSNKSNLDCELSRECMKIGEKKKTKKWLKKLNREE